MATPEVVAKSGTISLAWQPARGDLIVHRVKIQRGDQRIDVLRGGKTFTVIRREQQLERLAMDGDLTATIAVEGLQVGDVLRVTITTSSKDAALGGAVQDVTLLSDSTAAALDSRALVYFRLNRLDDASADLDAALDQRPDSAASLCLRGIVRARQGKAAAWHDDLAAATFIVPRIDAEYAPFGSKP